MQVEQVVVIRFWTFSTGDGARAAAAVVPVAVAVVAVVLDRAGHDGGGVAVEERPQVVALGLARRPVVGGGGGRRGVLLFLLPPRLWCLLSS